MSDYPECDRLAEASKTTQPIGEFLDWLNGQGIQLMTWREDLTDVRPTDDRCRERRGAGWPDDLAMCRPRAVDADRMKPGADYWTTHCLHWHSDKPEASNGLNGTPGTCCRCRMGQTYEITGLKSWVHDSRGYEQLLADYTGIDLKQVDAEKRQMLAGLRAMNETSAA